MLKNVQSKIDNKLLGIRFCINLINRP